MSMQLGSTLINPPRKRSKKEAIKDNRTKLFWSKLVREQGEVSGQQVQEDVAKGHVVVGLHCGEQQRHDSYFDKTNWTLEPMKNVTVPLCQNS